MALFPDQPLDAPVYGDIVRERKYQDRKWGGPANDDNQQPADWYSFINQYEGQAMLAASNQDWPEYRRQLVKVAALCVAAIESLDRKASTEGVPLP